MTKQEEEKQVEEIFKNLFKFTDLKEGMYLIAEEIKIRKKQGYDVNKYERKYSEELNKYPDLKAELN